MGFATESGGGSPRAQVEVGVGEGVRELPRTGRLAAEALRGCVLEVEVDASLGRDLGSRKDGQLLGREVRI